MLYCRARTDTEESLLLNANYEVRKAKGMFAHIKSSPAARTKSAQMDRKNRQARARTAARKAEAESSQVKSTAEAGTVLWLCCVDL